MKRITMLNTFASPEMVLLAGKTYRVEDSLAKTLCTPGTGASESLSAARPASPNEKLTGIPDQPDPGDKPEDAPDDEDDEDEDEQDDGA